MKLLSRGLAVICGLGMVSAASAAPEFTWTLVHVSAPGSTYHASVDEFAARIAAATDGRLEIKPNSSLVPPNRGLEAVRDGQVELAATITGFYTGSQPVIAFSLLPGVSDSLADLRALMNGNYGAAVREVYARDYNARELLNSAWCPLALLSKDAPIHTVEDWKGKRVRVTSTGGAALATNLGASPAAISTTEVMPSLQRGVINALVMDGCVAYALGYYTVAKHVSHWKLGSVAFWSLVANQDALAKLPEDLREIVLTESKKLEEEFYATWQAAVDAMPAKWEEKGVSFHMVSDEENARMLSDEYMRPVLDAWYRQAKKRGIDARAFEEMARGDLAR